MSHPDEPGVRATYSGTTSSEIAGLCMKRLDVSNFDQTVC